MPLHAASFDEWWTRALRARRPAGAEAGGAARGGRARDPRARAGGDAAPTRPPDGLELPGRHPAGLRRSRRHAGRVSGGGGIRTPGARSPGQRFSRPPHSTALPPLRRAGRLAPPSVSQFARSGRCSGRGARPCSARCRAGSVGAGHAVVADDDQVRALCWAVSISASAGSPRTAGSLRLHAQPGGRGAASESTPSTSTSGPTSHCAPSGPHLPLHLRGDRRDRR